MAGGQADVGAWTRTMHHGVMPSHARPGVFLHHLSCAAAAAEARMRGAEQYLYFYSNIRADNSFLVVHHREVIRSVISTSVIQHSQYLRTFYLVFME